jgi:hypothetical protein
MKKRFMIALSLSLVMVGAVALGRQAFQSRSVAPQQVNNIPPQVAYEQLFRQVNLFKHKADEKKRAGEDDSFLRTFQKRQAKLNDQQMKTLEKISSDCDDEVAKLDARAKQIIASFRALHQNEKLEPGKTPPPPPDELKPMQQQRDQIILQSREQVHIAFGDLEFQRFEQYVQQEIASRIKPIAIDWSRPDIPGGPRKHGQPHPQK